MTTKKTRNEELLALLNDMKSRTSMFATEALVRDLDWAIKLAEEAVIAATTAATVSVPDQTTVMDALVPGSEVIDAEGDLWRKTKKGNWRLQGRNEKVVNSSYNIVYAFGPVKIKAWEAPE